MFSNYRQRAVIEKKATTFDPNFFKPGDIVCFSSSIPSFDTQFTSFFLKDIFFHIGIMMTPNVLLHYINPNDFDVFKATSIDNSRSLVTSKINDAALSYPQNSIICVLRPPVNLSFLNMIQVAKDITNGYQYDYHYFLSFVFLNSLEKKLNCITFLGLLLEQYNVFKPLQLYERVRTYIPGNIRTLLQKSGFMPFYMQT